MPGRQETDGPRSSKRARKTANNEEIAAQRLRGELSCAECRRLKLKCDKKLPCSSCVRRGCGQICPSGILAAGNGTRFILAGTDELHAKIGRMARRIRELEAALEPGHPLLETPGDAPSTTDAEDADGFDVQLSDSIDALGTLTLGEPGGAVQYFGRSGGTETLLQMVDEDRNTAIQEWRASALDSPLPENLTRLASLFPFTVHARPHISVLLGFLPTLSHARQLCECYLSIGSLIFRALSKEELLGTDGFLDNVYQAAAKSHSQKEPEPAGDPEDLHPHVLATVFLILALGALLEPASPPRNAAAGLYHDLGLAALSLRAVFDAPAMCTVRAVGLLASYRGMAEGLSEGPTRDAAWCICGLAAKLSQAIGLHRDGAKWCLSAEEVQRRRSLFWEIVAMDATYSLALGRPPTIDMRYVDCAFPAEDDGEFELPTDRNQPGPRHMRYITIRDILTRVAETTLSASPVRYADVMSIDRKIRGMPMFSFTPLPSKRPTDSGRGDPYMDTRNSIATGFLYQQQAMVLLYLHRTFYVQAIILAVSPTTMSSKTNPSPHNPLTGPFAHSFIACTAAASLIIRSSVNQVGNSGDLLLRLWSFLFHAFSAAVVLGCVPARVPKCPLAPNALSDLGLAVTLFEKAAQNNDSRRVNAALSLLKRLQEAAVLRFHHAQSGSPDATPVLSSAAFKPIDKLAMFGGATTKVERKRGASTPRSNGSSPTSSGAAADSPVMTESRHLDSFALQTPSSSGESISPSLVHSSRDPWASHRSSELPSRSRSASEKPPSPPLSRTLPDGSMAIPDTGTNIMDMFTTLMQHVGNDITPNITQPSNHATPNVHQDQYMSNPQTAPLPNFASPFCAPMFTAPKNTEPQEYAVNDPSIFQGMQYPSPPDHIFNSAENAPQVTASGIGMNGFNATYYPYSAAPHYVSPDTTMQHNPAVDMDIGMDESWMSFMRDSGILDGHQ